jgi:deoxyribodipyrimidine photo-lyase
MPQPSPANHGPVQLVWLKRDLRVHDHGPLCRAAALGPVVVLYVFEPLLLQAPESDRCQWQFVLGSLHELAAELRRRGAFLCVRHGEMVEVLARLDDELRSQGGIAHVHSHQETGNQRT